MHTIMVLMKRTQVVLLMCAPLLASVLWLIWALHSGEVSLDTPALLLLEIAVPLVLLSAARRSPQCRKELMTLSWVSPCVLAPLGLLYPWVITPGNLPGISVGGLEFFITWASKYPDVGPVNIKVLLGILCMFLSAVLPVAFAFYARAHQKKAYLLMLAISYLVVYIPVLIALDLCLMLFGLASFREGAFALAAGPLFRMLVIPSMLYIIRQPGESPPRDSLQEK